MGEIVRQGEETIYRQVGGEITAWLTDFEEKMELVHEGASRYRRIFHLLVAAGVIYLIIIFFIFTNNLVE